MDNGRTNLDELKTMKAEKEKMAASKQAEADAIKGEIADLDSKITVLSGWKTGLFGAVGFNFNQSNNWQTNAIKNSTSASFSGSLSVFANRQAEKYFGTTPETLTWATSSLMTKILKPMMPTSEGRPMY